MRRVLRGLEYAIPALLLMGMGGCTKAEKGYDFSGVDALFTKENYARALVEYESALREDLTPAEKEYVRYRVGLCYMGMVAYVDAAREFREYLETYPQGRYTVEVKNALEELREVWEARHEEAEKEQKLLAERIVEIEGTLEKDGENVALLKDLADLYWRAGDFQKSTEYYARAIRLQPALERDSIIVSRVRMEPSGRIVPKIPVAATRDVYGNDGPLQVRNLSTRYESDLQGAPAQPRFRQYINVTGTVENTSIRSYGPVTIYVTASDIRGDIRASGVTTLPEVPGGESFEFHMQIPFLSGFAFISSYQVRLTYRR